MSTPTPLTPSPASMPRRLRRPGRLPLDDGGPLAPGHRLALGDVAAGLVEHRVEHGHVRWYWHRWPSPEAPMHIPRPSRWYLDELVRAGHLHVGGGVVALTASGAALADPTGVAA